MQHMITTFWCRGNKITEGNKNDASQAVELAKGLRGSMYGDKGYISKNIFKALIASFCK